MNSTQTFIADIGGTMTDINRITNDTKDKQKLFCKCGNEQTFNHKVRRSLVKNHDVTTEDKESVQTISCKKCGIEYNHFNKSFLLIADKEELFNIEFFFEKSTNKIGEEIITLIKKKNFALFNNKNESLIKIYQNLIIFIFHQFHNQKY